MLDLLKKVHDKTEEFTGKRLVILLCFTFFIFVLVGFGIGFYLSVPETASENTKNPDLSRVEKGYDGKIIFVDPRNYPQDKISFMLADGSGNEIILLKASDQKLEVAEGSQVTVYGKITNTLDGKKKVLFVERVLIKNAAN